MISTLICHRNFRHSPLYPYNSPTDLSCSGRILSEATERYVYFRTPFLRVLDDRGAFSLHQTNNLLFVDLLLPFAVAGLPNARREDFARNCEQVGGLAAQGSESHSCSAARALAHRSADC